MNVHLSHPPLKNCPHCASAVIILRKELIGTICCIDMASTCRGSGLSYVFRLCDEESAVKAWNDRAGPQLDHLVIGRVEPAEGMAASLVLPDPALLAFDAAYDPEVMAAKARLIKHGAALDVIPIGEYCYSRLERNIESSGAHSVKNCPYRAVTKAMPEQMNGYCAFEDRGDWQDGVTHIWDSVKCCGRSHDHA